MKLTRNQIERYFLYGILMLFVFIFISKSVITEYNCKHYIIKHRNEIIRDSETMGLEDGEKRYEIKKYSGFYYTDITIRKRGASYGNSYYVIFWGNRKSWLWNFKLDKSFSVNIPYDESKGKDVTQDLAILYALNEIK